MRPTRALISRGNFLHNLRSVRSRIGPKPLIMAVVKANAYGHGLEIIAESSIASVEVGYFGVATEEEGIALRKLTTLPILVLTTALEDEIEAFIANDLEFTLCDAHQLDMIASISSTLGKKAIVHLKVDTGMRRVGVEPTDALQFAQSIAQHSGSIEFKGISTHFATSDELDLSFFHKQAAVFSEVVGAIRRSGIEVPLSHAANSGAILQDPALSAFDMVRPGIMLYGYPPSAELDAKYAQELKPVLELVSSVVFTKRIKAGEGVSYNHRWHAERETTICTVPAGYGDGYPRTLTNRTSAAINGKLYPVRGTICMDQIMIEMGNDDVHIGDEVILISSKIPSINASAIAQKIGTIPYEILTNITARVPRIAHD
ncbi:MAG: alanine racemase [Bacteroidota bacterium]|nr:alanine racemase [Bacteroidota bacterium]MDP4230780.1 alanine racemase [Bacteroidota bacterium]MDP4236173.1 alanine racemase [Bacteroidota bacterium]